MTALAEPRPADDGDLSANLAAAAPPFRSAHVGSLDGGMLVVELDGGRRFAYWRMFEYEGNNKYLHTEASLSAAPVGAAHLLRVDLLQGHRDDERTDDGDRIWTTVEQRSTAFCGVGPSGGPSCTGWIPTKHTESREEEGAVPTVTGARGLAVDGGHQQSQPCSARTRARMRA